MFFMKSILLLNVENCTQLLYLKTINPKKVHISVLIRMLCTLFYYIVAYYFQIYCLFSNYKSTKSNFIYPKHLSVKYNFLFTKNSHSFLFQMIIHVLQFLYITFCNINNTLCGLMLVFVNINFDFYCTSCFAKHRIDQ